MTEGEHMDLFRRPKLVAHARLRTHQPSGKDVLLRPERALFLNATATAILARCDGALTVFELAAHLSSEWAAESARVRQDVLAFCRRLAARGWLVLT